MTAAQVSFDHVHLVSRDPHATAKWYADLLGGEITRSVEVMGAPQVYVSFGGPMVIVRGERPAEHAVDRPGFEWGMDHFGLRINGDFDAFCARLRSSGVRFAVEPTDFNAATRIAFVHAPDGVTVELIHRK